MQACRFIPSIVIRLRFVPFFGSLLMCSDHGLPGLHLLERLLRPQLAGVLEEDGGIEDRRQGATHGDAEMSDVADLTEYMNST